jgi:branched-chain amino acid transport system substrate-binding protein
MDRRQVIKLGAAAALAAATSRRAFADSPAEVKIGAIFPLTGSSAQVGVDAKHALETAVEIVNGDYDIDLPAAKGAGLGGLGGAKIKLILADHQGDPQKGRAEAERLITQDQVCAIVGTYFSSVAATVSQTCERYEVPLMAADTSSPSLHRRDLKYFFRAAAHDEMFSAAMFDFMDELRKQGKNINTLSLFFEDTIFGTDSSNVQRKLAAERGYKVVAEVKYKSNSPSLTSEVQQIKAAGADVLMPSTYSTDAILLVRTMAELGYAPKNIIAQAAGFADKSVYDAVGDKLEGLISRASFSLDLAPKRPSIKIVNDMFKARAGRDLNDNSSREFTALMLLADAIDRAKSIEGPKIRAALAETDLPGEKTIMPWRRVKFGPDGQNTFCDPVLLQYLNKTFVTIFPAPFAVGPFKWPMNA